MTDYASLYNTPLSPDDERKFQAWMKTLPSRLRETNDYDMRGAWKANAKEATNGHLPDTFKKPNHITFSDESIYNGVDGAKGGHWSQGKNGKWSFTPGPTNLKTHGVKQLQDYFKSTEKDSVLNLSREQVAYPEDVR